MTNRNQRHLSALLVFLIAGLAGARCALADSALASPTDGVLPLHLPDQKNADIVKAQERLYLLAEQQARYVITTVHPWPKDPTLKLLADDTPKGVAYGANSPAVQGFAFLYRFGPYDESVVGVSRKALLDDIIIPMLRFQTETHLTSKRQFGPKDKWGDSWQSAIYAQYMGRAAYWSWDDLPDDVRQSVRRVVGDEADRFVNLTPPYQLKGDTKAEENGWNSMVLDVAVLLMPNDPRRANWEKTYQRWALSCFLRPADEHSSEMIDGQPLSQQFIGANIYDDYTLENHDRVHPDYMGAIVYTLGSALDHQMTGRKSPEAIYHNVQGIYDNLKWFFLPDGGCIYPNGEDWELFTNIAEWPDQHVQMAVYMHDPDGWSLLQNCLNTIEKAKARDPNGPLYPPEENVNPGPQQWVTEGWGREWLMLQCADQINETAKPLLGVKRLDGGGIILHRTPKAIHTVSWGPVVMALCVPMQLDRVVSPDPQSGIGHVRLKGGRHDLPVKLKSSNITDAADGFVANLVIDHGSDIEADLQFRSNVDGTFVMREKLTALRNCKTSEIATGLIGVLNDPKWIFEKHHRQIQFDSTEPADIPSLSGKVVEAANVKRVNIDSALMVEAAQKLNVSYRGAKKVDSGRATDMLYLNYIGGEKSYTAGQEISNYEVVVTPVIGAHAAEEKK